MSTQHINYFTSYARTVFGNGYEVLPVKHKTKVPLIKKWNALKIDEDKISRWELRENYTGISIRTRHTPAVDLDIYDKDLVLEMVKFCYELIGAAPVRIGRHPKALVLYKTSEPFKKLTSDTYIIDGKESRVEILGDGQQLVAYGYHPDTEKPYTWKQGEPKDLKREDLPELSKENALLVIQKFEELADAKGLAKVSKGRKESADSDDEWMEPPKTPVGMEHEELESFLELLPYENYDQFIRLGMALHLEFKGAEEGFNLWDEWAHDKPTKYNTTDKRLDKWQSFNNLKTGAVTLRSFVEKNQDKVEKREKVIKRFKLTNCFEGIQNLEFPQWLIEGYIEQNTIGCLYASSSSYKSFIAIDMALSIATGRAWHGNNVKKGKVIYLAGEGGGGLPKRIAAWNIKKGNVLTSDTPLLFSRVSPDFFDTTSAKLASQELRKYVEEMGEVDLIVIDTLSRSFSGDENANSDMNKFSNNVMHYIANAFKCAVLIVHHTGKSDSKSMRGASSLRDSLDFAFRLERDKNKETMKVKLIDEKSKDHDDSKELTLIGEKITVKKEGGNVLDSLVFNLDRSAQRFGRVPPMAKRVLKELLDMRNDGDEVDYDTAANSIVHEYGICTSESSFKKCLSELKASGQVIDYSSKENFIELDLMAE